MVSCDWSRLFGRHGFCHLRGAVLGVFLIGATSGATAFGADEPETSAAERLVRAAHEAALSGQPANHFALLRQAIQAAPDFNLARWQLGQIKVDDQWLAVEEAQRRAAADPKYAKYRGLRTTYGDSAEGQLELARWSRKNGLEEEALFHWANVLLIDPNHEEALRAVGRRWYNGQLLTADEISQQRSAMKAAEREARRWSASLKKWERALSGNGDLSREQALEEIRSLESIEAIAVLEERSLRSGRANSKETELRRDISLAVLSALDKISDHAATESLVRHAVLSPLSDVRAEATYLLERRPLHDYVPLLLSGLAMPIESWFQVNTAPDGSVHYRHNLYRVGATADWSMEATEAKWHRIRQNVNLVNLEEAFDGVLTPREQEREWLAKQQLARGVARSQGQYAVRAIAIENQVTRENVATLRRNDRIIPVLAQTTGEEIGNNPQQWWDWWQNYNEYYVPEERPVYEQRYVDISHNYVQMMSCFAKGTPVWTKTGAVPIETLEMGDLVLSQDADTGELAYKPIIGRTVRPPSKILKLKLGGSELNTTLGHPFWISGVGWRMAKEVEDGAMLHAVTGAAEVKGVEKAGEAEAFNLVVADFSTYFVGEQGLLVHDNTPRKPTRAVVPGLVMQ